MNRFKCDGLEHNATNGKINCTTVSRLLLSIWFSSEHRKPCNKEYILILHVPSVSIHVNEMNVIAKVRGGKANRISDSFTESPLQSVPPLSGFD